MNENHDLKWLQANHPEAYDALPECYKADSVLVFFVDINGNLCAEGARGDHLEGNEWIFDRGWLNIRQRI